MSGVRNLFCWIWVGREEGRCVCPPSRPVRSTGVSIRRAFGLRYSNSFGGEIMPGCAQFPFPTLFPTKESCRQPASIPLPNIKTFFESHLYVYWLSSEVLTVSLTEGSSSWKKPPTPFSASPSACPGSKFWIGVRTVLAT